MTAHPSTHQLSFIEFLKQDFAISQSTIIIIASRKGTNPNYSYELYEFQYLLGIRRFVGTEMIKNLEFVGS